MYNVKIKIFTLSRKKAFSDCHKLVVLLTTGSFEQSWVTPF